MTSDMRALLLGVTTVVVAWLGLRGVPGALSALEAKEIAVEQQADLLARARARVASLPTWDDSIRVLEAVGKDLPHVLLVGQDGETAAVDLMRRLRELVAQGRVALLGFESRTESTGVDPLALTSLTARLETDTSGLAELIDLISSDPALAIESVDVEARNPHQDDSRAERLGVALTVSAWYRPAATADVPSEDFLR